MLLALRSIFEFNLGCPASATRINVGISYQIRADSDCLYNLEKGLNFEIQAFLLVLSAAR